jgi:hypothetical protein
VQRADAVERARDRQAGALEQQLSREQSAIQLAHGQDTLAHAPDGPRAWGGV